MANKKIYLIDDNLDGNRARYGAGKIDEGFYDSILVIKDKLCKDDDFGFISDAACVLLHRSLEDYVEGSYRDDSHFATNYIQKMIPELGASIPFAIFSDGDQADNGEMKEGNPNMIYSLGKKAFYGRLVDFLDFYVMESKIELRILAYGKDFGAKLIDDNIKKVFEAIDGLASEENVPPLKVNSKALKIIVENSQPLIGITYEELIVGLKLNPMKVSDFKTRLNHILSDFIEYGKNYTSWQQ